MGEGCSALRVNCRRANQPFRKVHQPFVISVGRIKLHHRKFGVVARTDTLVAEIAIDFKNAFKAADDQTLEVELGRDA